MISRAPLPAVVRHLDLYLPNDRTSNLCSCANRMTSPVAIREPKPSCILPSSMLKPQTSKMTTCFFTSLEAFNQNSSAQLSACLTTLGSMVLLRFVQLSDAERSHLTALASGPRRWLAQLFCGPSVNLGQLVDEVVNNHQRQHSAEEDHRCHEQSDFFLSPFRLFWFLTHTKHPGSPARHQGGQKNRT